jgi:tetratricopeptide (TPR) repeat protein
MHLSPSLIAAVLRGELPRALLDDIGHEHLGTLCPLCARDLALLAAGPGAAGGPEPCPAADPVEAVRRRLRWSERQLRDEEASAREWLKRFLRKVPAGHRCGKIRDAHKRYRGPLFGTLLLEEARRAIPADPAESLSLAEAALVSCQVTHPSDPDPLVRVPALAVRGNAKRALGRLREAEADLFEAVRLLDRSDLDDLAIAAELDSYFGSLRKDQSRLEEATRHLQRAVALFPLLGNGRKAARDLLQLGVVHYRGHRFEAAIASTEKALELLDAGSEGWLQAYARYNLAFFLHGRGDTDRAEQELAAHEELLAAAGEGLIFRAGWLRARIAWSRGELGKAERLFRETYRWAGRRGIPFDTGLVALELALVHLVRGRTARVRKLAFEALGIFAEQDVEREAHAALELLEAAARAVTSSPASWSSAPSPHSKAPATPAPAPAGSPPAVLTLPGPRHRRG